MTAKKSVKESSKGIAKGKAAKPAVAKKGKAAVTANDPLIGAATAGDTINIFEGAISKLGWQSERGVNIVCIDKETRTDIGVMPGSVVKVQKVGGTDVKFAMLAHQFKEYVGAGKASVSSHLATELGLTATDHIRLTSYGIYESEAANFKAACDVIIRQEIQTDMERIRAQSGSNDADNSDDDSDSEDDPSE